MRAQAITLGCRLNFAESEVLKARAPDGTILVNSCAVTAEAVRQTRQAIRRARRDRPGARIVVTGCAAQLDPESFAAMPEVDLVLGNAAKHSPNPFDYPQGAHAEPVEARALAQVLVHPSTSSG
jgi:threonylcarbamoyladenosine tRNA methylthiotransferase MtaB